MVIHDPVVKGKGKGRDAAYSTCDKCIPVMTGSRRWVNQLVRHHRKVAK